MAFKPSVTPKAGAPLPDFERLKSTFVGAQDQVENYLLYQTITRLIESTQRAVQILNKDISVTSTTAGAALTQLYVPMGAGDGHSMESGDEEWLLVPIDEPSA